MDSYNSVSEEDNEKKVSLISRSDSSAKPSLRFGWGKFRPQCLQFLNNPQWFLVAIIAYTLFQAMVILGFQILTLPSIEKRFAFTAKEIGVIAASNDVSALLVVAFIGFYGDYGNKIRWIGGGGVIVGLSTLLYALPHFLIGQYEPSQSGSSEAFCFSGNFSDTPGKCSMRNDSRWYYLMIFVLGQLFTGAGISSFYSLVPAYLDENAPPKFLPAYLGLWTCALFLGPGVGNLLGGKSLSIYVDLKQPAGLNLTARDPRWIGAWWLGFVIFGLLILVSAFIVLGFPRELAGAKELREKHIKDGHIRKANDLQRPNLKKILPQLRSLLTNWTFLFNTLGQTATFIFVSALLPFLPKMLQLKFGLKPEQTGYVLACMLSPGMTVGIFLGSIIVKRFPPKDICKKTALFIFVVRTLGFVVALSFIIPGCENLNLAGVSAPHNVSFDRSGLVSSFGKKPLQSSCNMNCRCSLSRFAPVCGSDNITYFDMCHAGCTSIDPETKVLGNCSCIPPQNPGSILGTAVRGFCGRDCKNLLLFVGIFALNLVIQFMNIVPDKTILLRCVPDNKRAFATGIQYICTKTLGMLPGPIIFGHVVDSFCRLWQDTCGKRGRCFDYDINKLSYALCILGASATFISSSFYFLAWFLYKPEENKDAGIQLNDSVELVNTAEETKV